MKIIGSRLGDESHNTATGSAKLGVVAVAFYLEFLNGINRRINKNGPARSHIDIVGAIYQKQICIRSAATDGDIRAAIQSFFVVAEPIIDLDARNESEQLGEAPAI